MTGPARYRTRVLVSTFSFLFAAGTFAQQPAAVRDRSGTVSIAEKQGSQNASQSAAIAHDSTAGAAATVPQSEAKTITVWKVGDPYRGGTPDSAVPPGLELGARQLGYALKVVGFPSQGFASVFFRAFENHQAPDILVFNFNGILEGGSTPLGSFTGIGTDPEIHAALVKVTGSLSSLQERAWQYLIRTSPNHEAARELAMRSPECGADFGEAALPAGLSDFALQSTSAYLEGSPALKGLEDSDRLHTEVTKPKENHIETIKRCGYWGTDHLAFVKTIASYSSPESIGWVDALVILRKQSDQWRLLAASTDPISTTSFVAEIPALVGLITKSWTPKAPEPATLVAPQDGGVPMPAPGARFGDFSWHPSPSAGEVAEILEFAYNGDDRFLAIFFSGAAPATEHCSAGVLWTTESQWRWRVWSISDSGALSFSTARSFPN